MRIVIDAMGGDNAPDEIVKGAFMALNAYKDIEIILTGNETQIRDYCNKNKLNPDNDRLTIVHTESVISMEDPPLCVVRDKSDSSMSTALRMLRDKEADAMVSAGSTGALHAGSTLIVRRIKGYSRSAIATILPMQTPVLLIDSGANTEVTNTQLEQFAYMGSIYMNKLFNIENPRVGLVNIGSEATKGTKALVEAYEYLSQSDKINFIGNVEGKDIPFSPCDVLVCDGYTGNIILKTLEGIAKFLMLKIKDVFKSNPLTALSGIMVKSKLSGLKGSFDASEYGGAPMLGISKPVFKSHGSSDALEIKNAVRQAINFIDTGVLIDIAKQVQPDEEEENDD